MLLLEYHLLRHRIFQPEQGLTLQRFITGVEDLGSNHRLIALTDESGHVGLDHQVFLSHSLTIKQTVTHILRMGKTHKTPGSETLGQGELQSHSTRRIRRQLGIEESCFVEILANLHLIHLQRLCLLGRFW